MSDLYQVTAGNPANVADLNQIIAALSGENDAPFIAYQPIANPGAPDATVSSTAGVLNGAYAYLAVFRTGYVDGVGTIHYSGNQTAAGTASTVVNPADNEVDLSNIPIGPTGVVARDLYRTKAGGSTFYYLATLDDNVTTDYTDNTPDSSLGTTTAPTVNSTGSPPVLPVYDAVPGFTAPNGALAFVNVNGTRLLYESNGTAWSAAGATTASPTTAGTVEITQNPASGTPTAVIRVADPGEQELTSTSATTVLTYVVPGSGAFHFTFKYYLRVITAATTVSATLSYTSNTGAQAWDALASQSVGVGDYSDEFAFQATGGSTITFSVTADTSDQVYVDPWLLAE